MYIETALRRPIEVEKSEPSVETTGQLGAVMQESARIAYTFAKVRRLQLDTLLAVFSDYC